MALVFYQRAGVSNEVIALTTSLLGLPWSLKPLWSPFLEMYKTRKFFVVCFEFIGGLSLALLALCLPLPGYFRYSIALLSIVGFCASSHDIVADGLYIASLNPKQQSAYAGWQGGFFNVARFFSQGGLIILAGFLEARMPILRAWMIIFGSLGVILVEVIAGLLTVVERGLQDVQLDDARLGHPGAAFLKVESWEVPPPLDLAC